MVVTSCFAMVCVIIASLLLQETAGRELQSLT
jgi:hypothetical protein